MIEFSELQSYLLYYGAVLASSIFAWVAQNIGYYKKEHRVVHPFFWILSFLCLFLPVAFRGYGVDHDNYFSAYEKISAYGWNYFEIYSGFPEPLYVLINILAAYMGDFQYVYILSGFISLFFTFKAFARKTNEINLAICVWMFSTLYYLNLFGLVRISIAVGIITYAYRYIEENNIKKYLAYVILATLFHYSAIIMLPLIVIFKNNYFDISRSRTFKKTWFALGILAGIFAISGYIIDQFQDIPWLIRYSQYFEGTNISVINNIAGLYPLILLMLFFGSRINRKEKYGTLYLSMFITMLIIILSSMIVSFMRLTYFLYPATYYLYSYIAGNLKQSSDKIIYMSVLFLLMTFWFMYRFTSDLWEPFLIPYFLNMPK